MKHIYYIAGYISLLGFMGIAQASELGRASWSAKASSGEDGEFPASAAIDQDMATRWSSAFQDGEWIEIDFGQETEVGGLVLHWETAYASAYTVELASADRDWKTVYSTEKGNGQKDWLYFKPSSARFLRLTCNKRATGWGNSLFEIDVLTAEKTPAATTLYDSIPIPEIMDGDFSRGYRWKDCSGELGFEVDFKRDLVLGGLSMKWGQGGFKELILESQVEEGGWKPLAAMQRGKGGEDHFIHVPLSTRRIRVRLSEPVSDVCELLEVQIFGAEEALDPLRLYEQAALRARKGLYPVSLLQEQVYWTVCGLPEENHEALFDEYGNVEPWNGAGQFMPYLDTGRGLVSAIDAHAVSHALRDGWKPMPSGTWTYDDVEVHVEAHSAELENQSYTWVKYTLKNLYPEPKACDFYVVLRPVQINPKWQHGGISAISDLRFTPAKSYARWSWNASEEVFISPVPDQLFHEKFQYGDLMETLAYHRQTDDEHTVPFDLDSGAAKYSCVLQPGETRSVFLLLPFPGSTPPVNLSQWTEGQVEAIYDKSVIRTTRMWEDRVQRSLLDVHDPRVNQILNSQIAYILINQDGEAIQPGSRNYNRTWMRDGSITATALLSMGLADKTKRYLNWYAERQYPSGMIPPILYTDGSAYHGYGADIEYDSQGQYIYAVMETVRKTGDLDFLRQHEPSLFAALDFLSELRARTVAPDYMQGADHPERFRGILPASISHEGYSTPHHSYWDDFWAMKGWRDGIEAAHLLGRTDNLSMLSTEQQKLKTGIQKSMKAVMDHFQLDTIPASAERGDADATSIAIALSPCDVEDVLPEDALIKTFTQYRDHFMQRADENWKGKYTPYEIRNVTALQKLGEREAAVNLHDMLIREQRPLAWNQFAEVVHSDPRQGSYIGDMPHTWVGSGYIHAVNKMLVRETPESLILFEGAPLRWFEGTGVRLKNYPTRFGPLSLFAYREGNALHVDIHDDVNTQIPHLQIKPPVGGDALTIISTFTNRNESKQEESGHDSI